MAHSTYPRARVFEYDIEFERGAARGFRVVRRWSQTSLVVDVLGHDLPSVEAARHLVPSGKMRLSGELGPNSVETWG